MACSKASNDSLSEAALVPELLALSKLSESVL